GVANGAAEINACDRSARACADAARLERDREGRPPEPLPQPRSDEADHARMPALGGGNDDRALLFRAERGHRLRLSLCHGRDLDHLALAVEAVEFAGDARTFGLILVHEQFDAERGSTDAAAGVDARGQWEAQVPRLRG